MTKGVKPHFLKRQTPFDGSGEDAPIIYDPLIELLHEGLGLERNDLAAQDTQLDLGRSFTELENFRRDFAEAKELAVSGLFGVEVELTPDLERAIGEKLIEVWRSTAASLSDVYPTLTPEMEQALGAEQVEKLKEGSMAGPYVRLSPEQVRDAVGVVIAAHSLFLTPGNGDQAVENRGLESSPGSTTAMSMMLKALRRA